MNMLIVVLFIIIGLIYQPIATLLLIAIALLIRRPLARSINDTITGR